MVQVVGPRYLYNAEELADTELGQRRAQEFFGTYHVTVDNDGIVTVRRKLEFEKP